MTPEIPKYTPYATNTHKVTKGRYITSNDPRGFLPVYEYPLNGQWIMMDTDDGYILWTGIWKALGNSKADIVKMIDSQPELASVIRRVRGGYLKIQGTWMPYEHAIRLARRVAWDIRHDLIPLFGPTFPDTCLSPDQPGYGQVVVGGGNRRRRRAATSVNSLQGLNELANASVAASSTQQNQNGSPTRTYTLQSDSFHPLPGPNTNLAAASHYIGHPHGATGRVSSSQARYSPSASTRDSRYAPYPDRVPAGEYHGRYHHVPAQEIASADNAISLELPPIHPLAVERPGDAARCILPPMRALDQDSQPSRADALNVLRRLAASEDDDCYSEPGRPSSSHVVGAAHRHYASGHHHQVQYPGYSLDPNHHTSSRSSFSPFSDDARSTGPASPITPATPPSVSALPQYQDSNSPRTYGKAPHADSRRVASEPDSYSTHAYP
ncbi:hypothetical protein BDV98DRAFT_614303 [Pterulicium gracile]|uniref:HTH APSES-type domain-containing protein n=1 Tax=Pterulicium gracile TaxID=1884261 RepID=A0A5C3Q6P8_9AGAR|nr:hypothetical protein BDV98DRAFT_614303 [Pterula gracilis]